MSDSVDNSTVLCMAQALARALAGLGDAWRPEEVQVSAPETPDEAELFVSYDDGETFRVTVVKV